MNLSKYLHLIGTDITIIETSGYPIVYGEINQNKNKTLSFYNHYDVQPEDPIELWDMDPYGAIIKDGKLYTGVLLTTKESNSTDLCCSCIPTGIRKTSLNVKFILKVKKKSKPPSDRFC